jgi:hypothetical protein
MVNGQCSMFGGRWSMLTVCPATRRLSDDAKQTPQFSVPPFSVPAFPVS